MTKFIYGSVLLIVLATVDVAIKTANGFLITANSLLDLHEIENFKYDFEISNEPVLEQVSSTFVSLTSVHGQMYQCNLTDVFRVLSSEEDSASEKKTGQSYNFTMIKEDLDDVLLQLKESNICVTKNQGWWTYEFCYGKSIEQYHLLINGSILEPKISLGNYSSEWNWLETNSSHMLRVDNKLYHEQYYDGGSLCDLSSVPRRTTIKLFCDEMTLSHIDSISEIETCVYEIRVHTSALCSIQNFNKKFQNVNVKCSPVLTEQDYSNYLRTRNEAELVERIDDVGDELEDSDRLLKELTDSLLSSEERIKGIHERTQLYQQLLIKSANGEDIGDVDLNDELKVTENELIKSADNLLKTDKLLKKLTNKLNNIMDNFDFDDGNLLNLDESADALLNENVANNRVNEYDLDDETGEVTSETTSTSIAEASETSTPKVKFKLSVIDANSNLAEQLKKMNQGGESVKNIEKSIKEELMRANGEKYKDVDVKIINLDHLNGINPNEMNSNLVSSIFDSMFGDVDNKKKLSSLNKNYNLIYNNGELIGNDKDDESEDADDLLIKY